MKTFTIIIISLILGALLGFSATFLTPTGQVTSNQKYSYTTAICNQNNCIDVLVSCENNQVTTIIPTSDLRKLQKNWKDFREKTNFCN